jgi:general secretion pathway protein G
MMISKSEGLRFRCSRRASRLLATRRRSGDGEAGFTLVEMLVVITIIGLIMGLIGPRVLNYLSESKVKAAKIQLQSFASALDLFYLDAGRFPSTAEGLAALVRRSSGVAAWNGPYLKAVVFRTIRGATPTCTARPANAVPMTSCPTARTVRRAAPARRPIFRLKT